MCRNGAVRLGALLVVALARSEGSGPPETSFLQMPLPPMFPLPAFRPMPLPPFFPMVPLLPSSNVFPVAGKYRDTQKPKTNWITGEGYETDTPGAPSPQLPPGGVTELRAIAAKENTGTAVSMAMGGLPLLGMGAGTYPGISPNAVANRMSLSVQGTAPMGHDCCSCNSNEEDYRVVPQFLELEAVPQAGFSPYGLGTRTLTYAAARPSLPPPLGSRLSLFLRRRGSMGLAPYGQDCCPCLANEEDYRVYPWRAYPGSTVGAVGTRGYGFPFI